MVRVSPLPVAQIWRYLKVGLVNTLFGYALYAAMVGVGLQLFAAQAAATVIAVIFNYFSYSRYVFAGAPASKARFALSYLSNYLVNLAALALSATILRSPYAAGLLATLIAAAVNFLVLRRFVFVPAQDQHLREVRFS